MEAIIDVDHLRKTYGRNVAVDDISFTVYRGEIFGIVGPNGAGKTTTVETLIGLRRPDSGRVRVLGLDPQRQRRALTERIGVQLQAAALPPDLKVWEALDLFAAFYRRSVPWEPLLTQWGLADKRQTRFEHLSGGQRQRLFIALALINDPELVVLDELTSGLDPQARRATWELVRAIRARGVTVVLVTHFMDEAEQLCDRVAIIDHGRLVALDTPRQLMRQTQATNRVRFSQVNGLDLDALRRLPGVQQVTCDGQTVTISGQGALLPQVVAALSAQGALPDDLCGEPATLEDVFLTLTGRHLRD